MDGCMSDLYWNNDPIMQSLCIHYSLLCVFTRSTLLQLEQAFTMLSNLRNKSHYVVSGVTLMYRNTFIENPSSTSTEEEVDDVHVVTFHDATTVNFGDVSDETIRAYIATGEPMDKAGAYGIQGIGGDFVYGIEGCYYNVMGFPRHKCAIELVKILSTSSIAKTADE